MTKSTSFASYLSTLFCAMFCINVLLLTLIPIKINLVFGEKGAEQKDYIGNLFLWNQPIIFGSMYFCVKVKGN